MGVKLAAASGGSVELVPTNTASNFTLTLPASTSTVLTTTTPGIAISGPAFFAYLTGTQAAPTNGVWTKITFDGELFDTNSNFASSRFTPTVAGYYQINSTVHFVSGSTSLCSINFYKNGGSVAQGTTLAPSIVYAISTSALVYMNGSTDYLEAYVYVSNTTQLLGGTSNTVFNGALVRAA